MTTSRRIPVVAAAILDGPRVLLAQRPEGKHLAGTWEFPGGKREPSETDAVALARELREELDVDIEVGALVAEVEHPYDDFTVHLRLYIAHIRAGVPRARDVADLRWVTFDEMRALPMPPADDPLVEALRVPLNAASP